MGSFETESLIISDNCLDVKAIKLFKNKNSLNVFLTYFGINFDFTVNIFDNLFNVYSFEYHLRHE